MNESSSSSAPESDAGESSKVKIVPGSEFMATFMESIRKGIESLSALPNDLSAKIDEAVDQVEAQFESRIRSNRASLFTWTGIPDPEQLSEIKQVVTRLEQRLEAIEQNVTALEQHPKGEPWPKHMPKKSTSRKK